MPESDLADLRDQLARTRWTDFDTGGHFAAMETPELLTEDIRAFYRDLR